MQTITEFKKKGKVGDRYTVFVDGVPYGVFELETLTKAKLKLGDEVSFEELATLQFESEKMTAFDKALSYLYHGIKTEKQIKDYLKNKGYLQGVCEYAIEKLKEYRYVDDAQFASLFVKYNSESKGKKLLRQELRLKGLKDEEIDLSLETIKDETIAIEKLAKKYLKNKSLDIKTKQKLYNHLLSKGFDYGDVKRVCVKFFERGEMGDDDWD